MSKDIIYRQDAIDALKAMAVPRYLDAACEDVWERDRTLDNAIDVMRALPSAQPERKTEDFEKGLHDMFDHIWNCEIEHPMFEDTVGELMQAVIQLYRRVVQPCEEGEQDGNQEEGS